MNKVLLVVLVVVAVAAILGFTLMHGGRALPTGDAAGVELPKNASPPSDYPKPPAAQAQQAPAGGQPGGNR